MSHHGSRIRGNPANAESLGNILRKKQKPRPFETQNHLNVPLQTPVMFTPTVRAHEMEQPMSFDDEFVCDKSLCLNRGKLVDLQLKQQKIFFARHMYLFATAVQSITKLYLPR